MAMSKSQIEKEAKSSNEAVAKNAQAMAKKQGINLGSSSKSSGGGSSKGSSNVQPSGRYTKTGDIIWEAKPTESDIKSKVAEKRIQKFSGTEKLSDTQRVLVSVGGTKKWVTPERALGLSSEGSSIYKEAESKIIKKKELEKTIRKQLEEESRIKKETAYDKGEFKEHSIISSLLSKPGDSKKEHELVSTKVKKEDGIFKETNLFDIENVYSGYGKKSFSEDQSIQSAETSRKIAEYNLKALKYNKTPFFLFSGQTKRELDNEREKLTAILSKSYPNVGADKVLLQVTKKGIASTIEEDKKGFTNVEKISDTLAQKSENVERFLRGEKTNISKSANKERLSKLDLLVMKQNLDREYENIEKERNKVDMTSEKDVTEFNKLVDDYNIKEDAYNKKLEEKRKDLEKIEKKKEMIRDLYYTNVLSFDNETGYESQTPGTISVKKAGVPIVTRLQREEEEKKLGEMEKEYKERWYPIDTNVTRLETMIKPGFDSSKASKILDEGVNDYNIHEARKLVAQSEIKKAEGTTVDLSGKGISDNIMAEKLKLDVTRHDTKKAGEYAGTVASTALLVAGVGEVLPALAKLPKLTKVIKVATSKPVQYTMWGLYGGTEALQVGKGIKEIKEGYPEAGESKIIKTGLRGAGVISGVSWLKGTEGKPYSKLWENIKVKVSTGKALTTGEQQFLKSQGMELQTVSKLDRYGNVYESYEVKPTYKTGQRTLKGDISTEIKQKGYRGWESKLKATPEGKGKITFKGQYTKAKPFDVVRGEGRTGVQITDVTVEGGRLRFDKAGKVVGFKEVGTTKQTPLSQFSLGKERWIAIDTKTGKYVEILPKDIKLDMGQAFVKQGGKWRQATEFKGWTKTDMTTKQWAEWKIKQPRGKIEYVDTNRQLTEYLPKSKSKGKATKPFEWMKTDRGMIETDTGAGTKTVLKGDKVIKVKSLADYPIVSIKQKITPPSQVIFKPSSVKTVSLPKTANKIVSVPVAMLDLENKQKTKPIQIVKPKLNLQLNQLQGLKTSNTEDVLTRLKTAQQTKVDVIQENVLKQVPIVSTTEKLDTYSAPLTMPDFPLAQTVPLWGTRSIFEPITPAQLIKVPPFYLPMGRIGVGNGFKQAIGIKQWTVTNPLRNLPKEFFERQIQKERVRRAVTRGFGKVRGLNEVKIKDMFKRTKMV